MTDYILPPAPRPSVAIHNSDQRFAVRRIFCVGKNYADHVAEMGNVKQPPIFFTKPADAIFEGGEMPYPPQTENFHHEAELVMAIGTSGSNISEDKALDHVIGYASGNDWTRRDLQANAKKGGNPWDMAKAFDNSAVIGKIHLTSEVGHLSDASITCTVDGEVKQSGNIANMLWNPKKIIAALSEYVTLEPGDLIYTGTPAGVSAVSKGQTCVVTIEGLTEASATLV